MRTEELNYSLPPELIARHPVSPRDSARMMVVRRSTDEVEDRFVSDLPSYLDSSWAMVVNDTRVSMARLDGQKEPGGGRVTGLIVGTGPNGTWQAMLRSNRAMKPKTKIRLGSGAASIELIDRDDALWNVRVFRGGEVDRGAASGDRDWLNDVGAVPLPPYILRARRDHGDNADDAADRDRYQTVYSDLKSTADSVAAPTAGLHFTPELLERIAMAGCTRHSVRLTVGAGTFKPIESETIDEHPMHAEWCSVPGATCDLLRSGSRKVLAIGTTTVRTLESLPVPVPAGDWSTDTRLLIAPGFSIRHVTGLLTNFHLPKSTLLALVAAFLGLERVHSLYDRAIRHGYRFYSYGDAMLILP